MVDRKRQNNKNNTRSKTMTKTKPRTNLNTKSNSDELETGLQYLELPYEEQLKKKRQVVEDLIRNKTKISVKVNDVIGMNNPYHYRNKVQVVVGAEKNGTIVSGLYKENTHTLVPFTSNLAHDKKADEIINSITQILTQLRIPAYKEDMRVGLVRHLLIKRGIKTDETMVVIVTSSEVFPGRNNFVKALRDAHPEITTIIQNINPRSTSVVLGDRERVLYGKGYITDILCGLKFNISAKSFYQVNPIQTEILYNKAMEFAGLKGHERVLDAYCGIGTIGLIASQYAKEVIGVEVNRDAVTDAIHNAKNNSIKNAKFICRDASLYMLETAQLKQMIDVIFLDPPRAGCDETFLKSLITLNPEKVVYISCEPSTLARDLHYLVNNQYKVNYIQPVDMFPHTAHVETVVLMSRK